MKSNIELMKKSLDNIDIKSLEELIHVLIISKEYNNTMYICGNGGSAGTATHIACDLTKIGKLNSISLCDNVPLITAITNDEGWDYIFTEQLGVMKPGDILMVISVHGGSGEDKAGLWSQNLVRAVEYAKSMDNLTISLTGFDGGLLKEITDININIDADSTPIVESMHSVVGHLLAFELNEGDRK